MVSRAFQSSDRGRVRGNNVHTNSQTNRHVRAVNKLLAVRPPTEVRRRKTTVLRELHHHRFARRTRPSHMAARGGRRKNECAIRNPYPDATNATHRLQRIAGWHAEEF